MTDILDRLIAHLIRRNRALPKTAQRLQAKVQTAADHTLGVEQQRQQRQAGQQEIRKRSLVAETARAHQDTIHVPRYEFPNACLPANNIQH